CILLPKLFASFFSSFWCEFQFVLRRTSLAFSKGLQKYGGRFYQQTFIRCICPHLLNFCIIFSVQRAMSLLLRGCKDKCENLTAKCFLNCNTYRELKCNTGKGLSRYKVFKNVFRHTKHQPKTSPAQELQNLRLYNL